jgi:hypothetical protein
VREVALILLLTFAYFLTRGLIRGRQSVALQHARQILDLERVLHLDTEVLVQRLATSHLWLMDAANFLYLFGHLPVLISVAAWLFWTRPTAYRWFRNAFLISAAMGLTVYVLFPTAPPRYLPGFTDTLKAGGIDLDGSSVALFYNPYAAMPSLHVGWSLLAGVVVVVSARAMWLRVAGGLLPVMMSLSVLMTGNHFLLDILAGCAIAVVSLIISGWWILRQNGSRRQHVQARQDTVSSATPAPPIATSALEVMAATGLAASGRPVQGRRYRAGRPGRAARNRMPPLL